ncbi:hypothetical protein C8T65DRAFT_591917 [Cerioporus squamosus]|nr:hypothetical protein C8T65DRAFT_591917 [Cerioporus squamosus]
MAPSVDPIVDAYWDALGQIGGLFRLDDAQYVFQGWDEKAEALQIGVYHHLTLLPRGPQTLGTSCTCSGWKARAQCLHVRVLVTHLVDLLALVHVAPSPLPAAVFLHSTPFRDVHIFSCVASTGKYESGKRVIVTYQREDRWHCQSCRYAGSCKHKPHAVFGLDVSGSYFLDSVSRCACGRTIATLSELELQTARLIPAILYGLARQVEVLVEVIPCPSCRHARRFLGPDLGSCGIFNWNNTFLFTHELLDSYTGSYTASETPFSAFCLATRRRYENYSADMKFCSEETFVRAWFAFIQLQELGGTMVCPTCGVCPPVVIADGVSLATHSSKLTLYVKPPTSVDSTSEEISSITPYKARMLPAIIQKELRSLLIRYLDATATGVPLDVPDISPLRAQYPAVSSLLDLYIRLPPSDGCRKVYKELLSQVCPYRLYIIGNYGKLIELRDTGTCYGLPQVRRRRVYAKLPTDNKPTDSAASDPVSDVGDCNKFYKTYSRNKLAGGILVLWCTHAICLGFHTIPIAEGRNDVFSAIYTRFPVAPEIIVYDFACQLAPYCFVREARYFMHTRFLIDEMHAHDHTRCGRACFASNLMPYDERVRDANTSAAECGNGGMGRIRKTVSYMKYEHSVVYTKTFLDIWNRKVLRRMSSTK